MKKSVPSTSKSRYQRQFGGGRGGGSGDKGGNDRTVSDQEAKAAEAAARRRLKQDQGEAIDIRFGYKRLEDQPIDPEQPVERRGWLYHMLPTTVSNS